MYSVHNVITENTKKSGKMFELVLPEIKIPESILMLVKYNYTRRSYKFLMLLQINHVYVRWLTVELPLDDVCMEDCSCSVLWEHCCHQTC